MFVCVRAQVFVCEREREKESESEERVSLCHQRHRASTAPPVVIVRPQFDSPGNNGHIKGPLADGKGQHHKEPEGGGSAVDTPRLPH